MSGERTLEQRLADYYAAQPLLRAPDRTVEAVLDAVEVSRQRREWTGVAAARVQLRSLVVAAVLIVVMIAAIGALTGSSTPPEPPTVRPSPMASSVAVPTAPAVWLLQDWPAPVRVEPDAAIVEMGLDESARWDPGEAIFEPHGYHDTVGDLGSAPAWIDIARVTVSSGVTRHFGIEVADGLPRPVPHPEEQWIAYGFVLDTDADGVADVRVGMDNMGNGDHRAWRIEFSTGRLSTKAGPPYGMVGSRWPATETDPTRIGPGIGLDTWYPGDADMPSERGSLWYTMQQGEEPLRFYAWASLIADGRVVATDYAPDTGWLSPVPQPPIGLVGPTWSVESWTDGDRRTFMPSTDQTGVTAYVRFTADGEVETDAACSEEPLRGRAVVGERTVRITDLVRPSRLCTGIAKGVDVAVLDVLLAPELTYEIVGGQLDLDGGTRSLRLVADDAQPPD